eukprot:TRINITY_DN5892_c0_g4_i1.p1 TRINITY_DN5892_c0_g4~~TRINITY_DN5892_c0_g4_i1.p1  ORF type:complete len:363 (+),score=41.63 TRINITY_DN5892_c0_g4_i1:130-1218(+)
MAVPCEFRRLLHVALAALVALFPLGRAQEAVGQPYCPHEQEGNVRQSMELKDGDTVYRDIEANQTDRYFHRNFNVTTMNQPDEYRKLLINLEPCRGVVFLFVKKTRRCYPNPYSCIKCADVSQDCRLPAVTCESTHFMSDTSGSRDGAPTFYEIPLTSTKYFVSVYAVQHSSYTLTLLADIGAFPRPGKMYGKNGKITARQLRDMQVQISWREAEYKPLDVTSTKQYWIYSALMMENDKRTNPDIFLRPDKIMNTVCGLKNNTDRHYDRVPAGQISTRAGCANGICNATIDGVITDQLYVFNIVAESYRGHMVAYGGLIMKTKWDEVKQQISDESLRVAGGVAGSVMGLVLMLYLIMWKLYG